MTTDTTSALLTGSPVDHLGRLVHEDDAAAQLALAVCRLEDALVPTGAGLESLTSLRVLTTDRHALADVLDVLTERLQAVGATPVVDLVEVAALAHPGQLVALETVLDAVDTTPYVPEPTSREGSTMTSTARSSSPADTLRGLCSGGVHLPDDPGYDAARTPWNLAVDLAPAAVAVPHSVEEVAAVVRAAADAGLRVAPQSTGHGAGPLGQRDLSDVVLLKLHELTGVTVDPAAGTARVVGGTQWHEVVAATAPHGFTALHGSAPDVAVAGYALSGGVSFYGRSQGVAANSVRAVEVVTGRGELVRADASRNADLFWALRGGGGNLGVVVAIEIELLPLPDVYAGMLLWDRERAPEVVRAWTAWTRTAPESVSTSLRIMSFPPLPELPPFLSGRQLVVIDGAVMGDDDRAEEVIAPLRALAPEMDTFGRLPVAGLLDVHMDPPGPAPAVSDHCVLRELNDGTIEALLAQVGPGTETPLFVAELRHLGGAFARRTPDGGAVSHIDGEYALLALAMAPFPEAARAGLAAARALVRALAPWSGTSRALTFTENAEDVSGAFGTEACTRLVRLCKEYDPAGTFLANHAVR